MKSLLQIYGKYIAVTWGVILALLVGNLGIFLSIGVYNLRQQQGPDVAIGLRLLENRLFDRQTAEEGFALTAEGESLLNKYGFVFLFVLNEEGDVIYRWRCPADFPDHYTAGEIAAFSRWYLKDYPVKVWRGEEGLLVAGRGKGTTWKYTMEYSEVFMKHLSVYLKMILAGNGAIILFMIGYMGYRFYRSMQPLSEGLGKLSRNQKVRIPENGSLSVLAAQLNKTSDILEKQRSFLERRDTARTEWIAGVSHDIRTPLAIIVGYADRLESEEALSDDARAWAKTIKEQSIRIRELIGDLNLTSKLAYHMQPLRITAFSPAALLRSLVAQALNEEDTGRYEMELQTDDRFEGIVIEGDEELLARAVRNLLGNSIRHNPQGCRIVVKGSAIPQDPAGTRDGERRIKIAVEDTGSGIPQTVIDALNASGGEKPHIMGLRIVKQIAEAHGGSFAITQGGHCVELEVQAQEILNKID